MTSPLFGDSDEWMDEDVGVYPAMSPPEPYDVKRLVRIAESRKAGLDLWVKVQKLLVSNAR